MVLMACGILGSSELRVWISRHGYIIWQQFTSEHLFILIMVIIRVISILLSPVFSSSELFLFCWVRFGSESLFLVHVGVQSFLVLFRFTHNVLIGSFSNMIFYLSMCHFSHECALHILCWCTLCFWYETSFHLYIMITLAWPIMEDIEPIDLGLRDRPREFETMLHFTFWSEQCHIYICILTL